MPSDYSTSPSHVELRPKTTFLSQNRKTQRIHISAPKQGPKRGGSFCLAFLHPHHFQVGVGIYRGPNQKPYWVMPLLDKIRILQGVKPPI